MIPKKIFGITVYGILAGVFGLIAINIFNFAMPWMLNVFLSIVFVAIAVGCLYGVYSEISE